MLKRIIGYFKQRKEEKKQKQAMVEFGWLMAKARDLDRRAMRGELTEDEEDYFSENPYS